MKAQKHSQETTCFKIRFSNTVLWLCVAVFALCGVGIGLSVWRIVEFGIHGFNDVLKYPFLIAVCVFCIVLVASILAKSQYVLDEKHLTTQYGFVKSKFAVKDVTSIVYDTDLKKLTVSFGEQYMTLSVDPESNEKLVRKMLEINPNIDYSFTLTEVPNDRKKKK